MSRRLLLLALVPTLLLADGSLVRSGPFEVISLAGDDAARETLNQLEQFRNAFGAALGKEDINPSRPVRVAVVKRRDLPMQPFLGAGREGILGLLDDGEPIPAAGGKAWRGCCSKEDPRLRCLAALRKACWKFSPHCTLMARWSILARLPRRRSEPKTGPSFICWPHSRITRRSSACCLATWNPASPWMPRCGIRTAWTQRNSRNRHRLTWRRTSSHRSAFPAEPLTRSATSTCANTTTTRWIC